MFWRSLTYISAAATLFLVTAGGALAETVPTYESSEIRITPRSVVVTDQGRQLHVVVGVENKLGQSVRLAVSPRQHNTYAFDDLGGKWSLGDPPTGIQSTFDACNDGTTFEAREIRPILFRLAGTPNNTVAAISFGTVLHACAAGLTVEVPVTLDRITISVEQATDRTWR